MLGQLNIRKKLALALWGAALLAFVLAGMALVIFENLTLERRAGEAMEPYAQLVSVGVEAAVAFEDPARAKEILETLRANPEILEAEIVLENTGLLVGYSRNSRAPVRLAPLKPAGVYLQSGVAELVQSLPGRAHLRLVMSLAQLERGTRQILWAFGAGGLTLLAITACLLVLLQRSIVRPIATLAETAEQVRAHADYRQRVPAAGTDEVARLGQSFNAMMAEVEKREQDLRHLTLFQRTILDNAAYGIVSATPDGIVTSFNPAAEQLLGYRADEVVGKQTPVLWHDAREVAQRARQLSEELGEPISPGFEVFAAHPRRHLLEEREWTFVRKGGTRVPVLLSVTALRDESGQITGFVGMTNDLTARNKAEQALREREEKYRTLLEKLQAAVVVHGPDSRIVTSNPVAQTLLGLTEDQLLGKTAIDPEWNFFREDGTVMPPEEYPVNRVNAARQPLRNLVVGVRRSGNPRDVWVLANADPVFDGEDAIAEIIVTFIDITGRKHAEVALQKTAASLGEAQRLAHIGNWELDLATNVLLWSDEIYRIFEIDPAKFGASYAAFLAAIHPDDREAVNAAYTNSVKTRTAYTISHRLRFPDGRIKHVHEQCETFYAGDRPVRSVGTVQDITEFKQAEAALRESQALYHSLVEQLPAGIFRKDAAGRFVYVNPWFCRLKGLNPEVFLGKLPAEAALVERTANGPNLAQLSHRTAQAGDHHRQIMDTGRSIEVEEHGYGPDGKEQYLSVRKTPIRDLEGKITGSQGIMFDITASKQAEEKISYLASIVESTDDAVIGKSLDEEVLSWNKGAERIYGYTAGEIIGRSISHLVPPDRREELVAIMARLRAGEKIQHLETVRQRKDGQAIDVALTISPIKDASDRIVGASTIARDISERKRVDDALLFIAQRGWQTGAENFFDALAQFLGKKLDMDYVLIDRLGENPETAETVALYARGAITPNMCYALKGTPCENVMGKRLCVYPHGIQQLFPEDTLLPGMGAESYIGIPLWDSADQPIGLIAVMGSKPLPDDAPVTHLLQLVATRAAAELERKRAEERIRRLNAELEQRVADRTRELALSEERMRLFFEHQLVGTAITSPEKDWLQVNDKLCQMLGYSREELMRRTWMEMTHPDDLAPDVAQFERLLKGEIENYTLEKRFVRKDGSVVFTALAVGCVRRSDRSLDYVLALLEDITERKRAEESIRRLNVELRQRALLLEAANKELEAFSYSVSHDLRAPLRSINGFSGILLKDSSDKLDAAALDNVRTIRAASLRMGQLIDDMLKLARVTRTEPRRSVVDLSALAAAVAAELRTEHPDRNVTLVIEPGLTASADAGLIRAVLENLFGNAWKFTSKQPSARIEFGRVTTDAGPAFFTRDDGAGFDPEFGHKLFKAFQRLHSMEEFPGTGVGLATVQRIIHRHGGRVWAEGTPGHGATFYFTLPA